ncbi:MAG: prepilin-type N-terminal cleavage/methylation domain-containing protein [Thermodesulfobacteriota bacterium]
MAANLKDAQSLFKKKSGFTLLEVLVALVLLGMAVTAMLQLFSANLNAISKSEGYVACSLEAQSKMREVLEEKELSESSWSGITANGYRYQVTVAELLKERTDSLPLKLLEVEVRLYWNLGVREKTLSLNTMKMVEKKI